MTKLPYLILSSLSLSSLRFFLLINGQCSDTIVNLGVDVSREGVVDTDLERGKTEESEGGDPRRAERNRCPSRGRDERKGEQARDE